MMGIWDEKVENIKKKVKRGKKIMVTAMPFVDDVFLSFFFS